MPSKTVTPDEFSVLFVPVTFVNANTRPDPAVAAVHVKVTVTPNVEIPVTVPFGGVIVGFAARALLNVAVIFVANVLYMFVVGDTLDRVVCASGVSALPDVTLPPVTP